MPTEAQQQNPAAEQKDTVQISDQQQNQNQQQTGTQQQTSTTTATPDKLPQQRYNAYIANAKYSNCNHVLYM